METINKGDLIKTKYGDWHEVREVRDNVIYVYDALHTVHCSNVIKVIKGE